MSFEVNLDLVHFNYTLPIGTIAFSVFSGNCFQLNLK